MFKEILKVDRERPNVLRDSRSGQEEAGCLKRYWKLTGRGRMFKEILEVERERLNV